MKRIILSLILAMFLISFASATIKNYDAELNTITISNGWTEFLGVKLGMPEMLGGEGTADIATYTLTDNTNTCLIDCYAEGTVSLYNDGAIFDDINFKDLNNDMNDVSINDRKFYISNSVKTTEKIVDDYNTVCNPFLENNGTYNDNCTTYQNGSHIEEVSEDIWEEYQLGTYLIAGDYKWRIEGKKNPTESLDWIVNSNGEDFNEWASWNSTWNNNILYYYNMSTTSSTNLVNGSNNITDNCHGGCSIVSGISGNAVRYLQNATGGGSASGATNMYVSTSWFLSGQAVVSMWVNKTGGCSNGNNIVELFGADAGGDALQIRYQCSSSKINIYGKGGAINLVSTDTFPLNKFNNVLVIFNLTSTVIYFNGVKEISAGVTINNILASPNYIGDYAGADSGNRPNVNITFDEIAVWNRTTMSDSEISDLYNNGSGIFYTNIFSGLTMTNIAPTNNQNITTKNVTLNCSALGVGITNVTSVVLNATNGTISWNQTITGLNTQSYTASFNNYSLLNGAYSWNCIGYGSDGFNSSSSVTTFNQQAYTIPNIYLIQKTPADITSTNMIGIDGLQIYNVSSNVSIPINFNTGTLYSKTNNTFNDITYFINGTAYSGYITHNISSNTSTNISFIINDNDVYPAIYNINQNIMEATPHSTLVLGNNQNVVTMEFLNLSNQKQYGILEIMANSSAASSPANVYYCNSTYTTGVVNTNANCILFCTIPAGGTYNHSESSYSSHQVCPFAINATDGTLSSKKVTPTSYFVFQAGNGAGGWNAYYIANTTRTTTTRTSTNLGNSYTAQTYTIDSHIHQYSSIDTYYYYSCINDTNNNNACSTVGSDLINLSGMPPTAPFVYSPDNLTYKDGININWTASQSPNGYAISAYNVTLWNAVGTFNQTIVASTQALSTVFNSVSLKGGSYYIEVRANDTFNQQSFGRSQIFSLDNQNPNIQITYPVNSSTYNYLVSQLNYTVSDLNLQSCWYSLNGGANTTIPCGTNISGIGFMQNNNTWTVYANDSLGNINSSSVYFVINISAPVVNIVYPLSINYNKTITAINYTVSGNGVQSCWYSTNSGATNVSINCGQNITGLASNEGSNTWIVYANESAFGLIGSSSKTFITDTTNPNATLISPANGSTVTNSSNNFTVSLNDTGGSGINQTTLNIYSGNIFNGLCYQETANNRNVLDSNCNQIYSGSYSAISNLVYVNYTKPNGVVAGSIWETKMNGIITNVSIPLGCWNRSTLQFRLTSANLTTLKAFGDCYNGTDWLNLITTVSGGSGSTTGASCNIAASSTVYDGNWNTGAGAIYDTTGLCYSWDSFYQNNNQGISEEAMIWNISSQPINQTTVNYDGGFFSGIIGTVVQLVNGVYSWFYTTIDNVGNTFTTQSYTITINKTSNITIINPINTLNYHILGTNETLNWTVTDPTGLSACWYVYKGTTYNVNCAANSSSFLVNDISNSLTFYVNDTLGNPTQSLTINWNYLILSNGVIYNNVTTQGNSQTYILNLTSSASSISSNFIYNGTTASAIIANDGTNTYINSNYVPLNIGNNIFYWNIVADGNSFNTTSYSQTVNSFQFDNCSNQSTVAYNLTTYDEDTKVFLPETIEAIFHIYVYGTKTEFFNYSSKTQNGLFCINSNSLNNSQYTVYYESKYYNGTSGGYSIEYKYGQNITLNNNTIPQNIALYDLLASEATEFKINFRDQYLSPVSGALIDIQRQYMPNDQYLSVETPQTDQDGNAYAHLIQTNQVYTIVVSKDGQILATFDRVVAKCGSTCEIDLNAVASTVASTDWNSFGNINTAFSIDKNTRKTQMIFSTIDNTVQPISWDVSLNDQWGNNTICTNSLITQSGTFTCNIPIVYGNTTIIANAKVNNETVQKYVASLDNTPDEVFGPTRVIFALLMYSTLVLMFISNPITIVIGGILGLVFAGILFLVDNGSFFGSGAIIMFFIFAGGIILWQINKRLQQ